MLLDRMQVEQMQLQQLMQLEVEQLKRMQLEGVQLQVEWMHPGELCQDRGGGSCRGCDSCDEEAYFCLSNFSKPGCSHAAHNKKPRCLATTQLSTPGG